MRYIDFDDSKELWKFGQDTINLAEQYQESRVKYAEAIKALKMSLAEAYLTDDIKESISEEKAYLKLVNTNVELKTVLSDLLHYEQEYKGLEKVIETRLALVSLNQSLIKNKPEK